MTAYIFPGQGAQFVGMGHDLYEQHPVARQLFEKANEILGFSITDIMFRGTDEQLKQTAVTQPAVFIHSVISALCLSGRQNAEKPAMVGGHSLGEFSALVVAGSLSFEDGLRLVAKRAAAMQKACEAQPGSMAAIIALPEVLSVEQIEDICKEVSTPDAFVIPANYNCPGQLVISGHQSAVEAACQRLKEAGAKRALMLNVSGAFHSPLMMPAQQELAEAIEATQFQAPQCPIYQNVDGKAHTAPEEIKANLLRQLTSSVRWTEEITAMADAGATEFIECGPGKALQGMVVKICKDREGITARGVQEA